LEQCRVFTGLGGGFCAACSVAALGFAITGPALAADGQNIQVAAQAPRAARPADDRQILLRRLQQLEQRLNQVEGARGMASSPPPALESLDTKAILDRLDTIDNRLNDLETYTVTSQPKTIVKQVDVYVDQNGNEFDTPRAGATRQTTFQRERVFRRQTVEDAIEEALADQEATGINLGVSSVTTVQVAIPTRRNRGLPDTHVYGVSQADVTFLAKSAALNTSFFADLVGIGGSPPDAEIPAVSLLNSQEPRV